jgi:hypothetical protein
MGGGGREEGRGEGEGRGVWVIGGVIENIMMKGKDFKK